MRRPSRSTSRRRWTAWSPASRPPPGRSSTPVTCRRAATSSPSGPAQAPPDSPLISPFDGPAFHTVYRFPSAGPGTYRVVFEAPGLAARSRRRDPLRHHEPRRRGAVRARPRGGARQPGRPHRRPVRRRATDRRGHRAGGGQRRGRPVHRRDPARRRRRVRHRGGRRALQRGPGPHGLRSLRRGRHPRGCRGRRAALRPAGGDHVPGRPSHRGSFRGDSATTGSTTTATSSSIGCASPPPSTCRSRGSTD